MEEHESKSSGQLPPPAVCIAAAIFIAWSVSISIHMLVDILWRGRLNLNIGILVWFVGTGLLGRKMAALRWAQFLFGAGFVALLVALAFSITPLVRGGGEGELSVSTITPGLVTIMLSSVLCGFGFWLLRRPGVKDWMALEGGQSGALSKMLVYPIAVVAVIWGIGAELVEWSHEQDLAAIYEYDVKFFPYDRTTGKGTVSMSIRESNPPNLAERGALGFRRRTTGGVRSDAGDTGMQLSGLADQQIEVVVGSEGYEPATVTITRENAHDEIRVPLKPRAADD